MFYGYDILMENVLDLLYIDFVYYKVIGRREWVKFLFFKVYKSGLWGFIGVNNDSLMIFCGFYLLCYYYNKYVVFYVWIFNINLG